jgi:hypothetical protein
MISCIQWIPKNVADPNPKRYELSKAERQLLAEEQKQNNNTENDDSDSDNVMSNDEEEVIQNVETPKEGRSLTATEIIASQKIDPSSLPKELRMDDYSDDEDGNNKNSNDNIQAADTIGDLLIGNDSNPEGGMLGIDEDGNVEDVDIDSEGDSDDDYDDMGDIPDTREYTPTDVRGLEAMNFGGYTGMNEFEEGEKDDDDSDIDDTNLKPDDALIIAAKTEEVRLSI